MASDIISTLYDSNFITQTANNETGITLYRISDNFLIELIKSGCSENEQLFYKTKIYRAIQSKQISANLEQIVNLAIELGENEAEDLVLQYIRQPEDSVPDEKKQTILINYCTL